MFDCKELREAVNIQQRTYRLLQWISMAMHKGFVTFQTGHEYASASDVAAEWIGEHFYNLPANARPECYDKNKIQAYANVFSTYLLTSFDIIEKPGWRLVSGCGCYCPMCAHLVAASHLRRKKLKPEDKYRARKLKAQYLESLALDCDTSISTDRISQLLEDGNLKEKIALATYGAQLLLRVKGHVEGPALLALWREFAYNEHGSPKQNFQLNEKDIVDSESHLVDILKCD